MPEKLMLPMVKLALPVLLTTKVLLTPDTDAVPKSVLSATAGVLSPFKMQMLFPVTFILAKVPAQVVEILSASDKKLEAVPVNAKLVRVPFLAAALHSFVPLTRVVIPVLLPSPAPWLKLYQTINPGS